MLAQITNRFPSSKLLPFSRTAFRFWNRSIFIPNSQPILFNFKPIYLPNKWRFNFRNFSVEANNSSSTNNSTIKITDKCVQMIHKLVKQDWVKDKEKAKLRVEVKAGGCSGFEYDITVDDQDLQEEDIIFEREGAKVVVDKSSLEHLGGSTIDYEVQLIKSGFVVNSNPNAVSTCGCKHSFASKKV